MAFIWHTEEQRHGEYFGGYGWVRGAKTNTENKNQAKETPRRKLRQEARVTKEEYAKVAELAQTCGLSMSDYIRHVATGHKHRRRCWVLSKANGR